MRHAISIAVLFCAVYTPSAFVQEAGGGEAVQALVLNEDNSHFYFSRKPEDMTLEGLHAFVDQYADTSITHLFLCPNAMRASFRSSTRDAIWDIAEQEIPAEGTAGYEWRRNARLLDERGLDPYVVWIARAREKGISPWITMRMNDVHDVPNTKNYMHSTFWVQHPEYWRVPGGGGWVDRAMDYAVPAVREHQFSFVAELLERYDMDGLELDWMRFGYHLRPGHEREDAAILTEFVRQARALANEWAEKRGHPIKLSARIPAHPDAAAGLGMDGVAWAREGLVDVLVPTPFWTTSDFDIPVEVWKERLGPAAEHVVIAPGIESNVRAYPSAATAQNDLASVYGFAAASLHRGADWLYMFNYMDPAPIIGGPEAFRTLVEKGLSMDVVTQAPRRHPVTFHDTVPPGFPAGVCLPVDGKKGGEFRIYIGPKPASGKVTFVAGLAKLEGAADALFECTVNGQACEPASDLEDLTPLPGTGRAVQFTCPLDAVREGYNDIAIKQTGGEEEQRIVTAEIRVNPGA